MTASPIPGRHGGDGELLAASLGVAVDAVLDLSASLNPAATDIVPLAARHLGSLRRYPQVDRAEAVLAEHIGVEPERLILTNGGAEAIALVAAEHPVGWASSFDFSLYRRHLHTVRDDASVWRSDPHNPTGRLLSRDDHAFVRDEAFYPLAAGRWTRGDTDSIVVGSLTKLFACPGLRLGYVVARDGEEARRIRDRRPEWSVNSLAIAVLDDLLSDVDLPRWRDEITALRHRLVVVLRDHNFDCAPSDANYVWIPLAHGLRDRLAAHAILVRDGTSFGYRDAVRVAVCNDADLARLASALDRSRA